LADEEAALAADEQKKIDIKIRALQQFDALKSKAPTYGTDASAQAELARNQDEIAAFQVQKQTVAIEANDRAQKAIYDAQIESITEQIAAAQRGSQENIDLIQNGNASYGPPEEVVYSADSVVCQTPYHRQQQMLFQQSVHFYFAFAPK
jgi:hypothetical protein